MSKKSLGKLGESLALKYYLSNDFILLAKNYLTRFGELDLVMLKNNFFYGIEIKTRTNYRYGFAEETIDKNKVLKMQEACHSYCPEANWHLEIIIIYLQGKQAKIKRFPIDDY
jgi:putative endonuclease